MLVTENGGKEWQPYPLDELIILTDEMIEQGVLAPNLYDIFFVDGIFGWIVGENGIVFKTSDGGRQWELLRIGFFPPLFSVFFKNESEGWAAGQNGLLLHSEDGGRSWVAEKVPAEANLYKIRMVDDFGLILGDKGTVLETRNGGSQWTPMRVPLFPPFPFFADAWVIANSLPKKIIFMGERVIPVPIR
jgi:photosystem II stability/assembly factor-like uncharacterized protein